MEYEPKGCKWLVQELLSKDAKGPYPSLPWKLGIMAKVEFGPDCPELEGSSTTQGKR